MGAEGRAALLAMRMGGSSRVQLLCLLLAAQAVAATALRRARVELPAVVRAGGSAQLRCLFDLEGESLYAVKWYRGTREFFRFEPANHPPAKEVPFPGIVVDLAASNAKQVVLRAVPPHLSGTFSCEVSADAPSFSTAVAQGELIVTDFPDLKISSDLYDGGQSLTANCTYQPLKLPTSLTFYVNNEPAQRGQVHAWAGGASLRLLPRPRDVSPAGELHLRCELLVDGHFPVSSDNVTVRLPLPLRPPTPTPTPISTPTPTPTRPTDWESVLLPPEGRSSASAVHRCGTLWLLAWLLLF